jgi:hypothetical protein
MRTTVTRLGLLLLMGSFGMAQQQRYSSEPCGFTVQSEAGIASREQHSCETSPELAPSACRRSSIREGMTRDFSGIPSNSLFHMEH